MEQHGIVVRRVVTGVDFQESSRDAVRWTLGDLAPDASHDLLHVLDVPELPLPLQALSGNRDQLLRAARNDAQQRLQELAGLTPDASADYHVREGRPSTELIRLAEEVDADLIVVGEGGPARGLGALLGSTAERVLHGARSPVLVARKVPEGPPLRILAAVDPSEVTGRILAWAGALLAAHPNATLMVMNVVDRVFLLEEFTGLPTIPVFKQFEEESVAAMNIWLRQEVEKAGLPASRVQVDVRVGDPGYEIIAESARQSQDLILLGSKGGDVARTPLIGRIINKVVRSAPCSVLVVPPP